MPLPIRDGNQSLTTLSTLIVNSAHVPAHTVVSLGSQAITDIAQAVSGVELGPNSISALEHISVTISAGTSITVGNVVSVTGGLTNAELRASSVTIGGSVQVSNFPATQSVTFSNPTITGSVSILNLPATQAVTFTQASVTFTQASVTFGQAVVSASNIGDLLSSVAMDNTLDATTKFVKIGGHQSGSNQTSHIVHVSAGGSMSVDASGSSVTFTQASVTFSSITGSVSVLNFPATQTTTFSAITGSVSVLNLPATQTVTFTQASVTFGTPVVTGSVSVLNFPSTQTISGTVTANNPVLSSVCVGAGGMILAGGIRSGLNTAIQLDTATGYLQTKVESMPSISGSVTIGAGTAQIGSVTASISNSITVASLPAISGTVTANTAYATSITGYAGGAGSVTALPVVILDKGIYGGNFLGYNGSNTFLNVGIASVGQTSLSTRSDLPVSGTITIGNSITIGSIPSISGTVTIGAVSTSVTVSQIQGTSVTTSNFTSTTASQTLVSANSARRGLTVFNEGAGNLHICAGATATTLAYQVRLSAGDYWECPAVQTSLTHSAQFASAGTARIVEIL